MVEILDGLGIEQLSIDEQHQIMHIISANDSESMGLAFIFEDFPKSVISGDPNLNQINFYDEIKRWGFMFKDREISYGINFKKNVSINNIVVREFFEKE